MYIIIKARLRAASDPPLTEGSEYVIRVPADSLTWGVYNITIRAASGPTTLDWGDGTSTVITASGAQSHTYAAAGTYRVHITDTITGVSTSYRYDNTVSTIYAPMIQMFRTVSATLKTLAIAGFRNCRNMTVCDIRSCPITSISANLFENCASLRSLDNLPRTLTSFTNKAFYGCAALSGRVNLPTITDITATAEKYAPFLECPNITELHFSAASEATIRARPLAEIAFGAPNATLFFDL